MIADMHVHTVASDGRQTPEEVVLTAKAVGLNALAVTDHDTVYNTENVNSLCAAHGIAGINGVEISAYIGATKLHTLGYGFDLCNPQMNAFLNELVKSSEKRAGEIVFKLNAAGVKLKLEDVSAERISDKTPIHAMHIARAAVKKGYGTHPFDFYQKYMMYGQSAFSNIFRPTPEEAIEVINAAGGFASLAHPGRIELCEFDLKMLVERLVSVGLKGIEAVYSTHTEKETAYFKELAEEHGLLVTGGSDAHAPGSFKHIGDPVFHMSEDLRQMLKI